MRGVGGGVFSEYNRIVLLNSGVLSFDAFCFLSIG